MIKNFERKSADSSNALDTESGHHARPPSEKAKGVNPEDIVVRHLDYSAFSLIKLMLERAPLVIGCVLYWSRNSMGYNARYLQPFA
jgi:hypothetical protein